MLKYSFDDIIHIENNIKGEIDCESKEILERLKKEINAPGYIKTPNFIKQDVKKKTKINKSDNPSINEIKTILNKLSEKNYDDYYSKIIKILKDNDYSNEIYETIFNTIFLNEFLINIYTKLVSDIKDQDNFENNLTNFINTYESNFKKIRNEDVNNYSEFCLENTENENRLSITKYVVKLFKLSLIKYEKINGIISKLFKITLTLIKENKDKKIIEKHMNIIFILISNLYNDLNEDDIEKFTNILTSLSMLKTKDNNITNKTIFISLDLLELLNNI